METQFQKADYQGGKSTLCVGCGHDQITQHIMTACFQAGINPAGVLKMSGIGCSSKTPAYFLGKSFGFNSMHGRMAPVATGAGVVQSQLVNLGVSGDGDTASIGLGGFAHLIRRNLRMTYIVANNGVYGLTKGQFSATSDMGAQNKGGDANPFTAIDLCSLAIELGCTFVARSFSGDPKQLVPLIRAAMKHRGTAFIDVISPCVTFNNHNQSTKSFAYVKSHDHVLQELGVINPQEHIEVQYDEGTTQVVEFVDGSKLTLKKIDSRVHNLNDSTSALRMVREASRSGEILTGLFYVDEIHPALHEKLNLGTKSLAELNEKDCRLKPSQFAEYLSKF
ncbi:MAG TPA: thiamine pyrophosphate-dependent enzyme [Pseudobdellovibrionaceae bacterium]|nr:thiamine pyrophosphate-dependent enzyme [Pseudobdellovibrionaceae bacterium]